MRFYSIIIPVYNRPTEIKELLESLCSQTYKNFEVLIIEDGSTSKCEEICLEFAHKLTIRYFFKENSGQGFSRNFAFMRANGDYFIQFDSDVIVPDNYLEIVENSLNNSFLDAFGGPDAAAPNFTEIQKAINFSMTSVFTTGGIRGKKKNLGGQFHPRSFNFGISRKVFEKVGGYKITRLGEDIEFSIRIIEHGFKVGLIPEAFIYHKRRTSIVQFFKQLHFFGRARINISRFYPKELKLVHFFPVLFLLFIIGIPFFMLIHKQLGIALLLLLVAYISLIFIEAYLKNKNIKIAFLAILTSLAQLLGYGIGFATEAIKNKKKQIIVLIV